MEIIILSIVAAAALGIIFLLFTKHQQTQKALQDALIEKSKSETENQSLSKRLQDTQQENLALRDKIQGMTASAATAENELSHLNKLLDNQKKELLNLQERFKSEFEVIANKLLEEKSQKFTEQNKVKLDELLKPLGDKIRQFEEKVENTNKEGIERNASLVTQIEQLRRMNHEMSEEARNLTKALKGDTKAQGNWGEVILERILEKSGLRKGFEYTVQESSTNEEGRRLQPDVVIQLPDNKNLIIDSKVSLVAYERYASAETPAEQQAALKMHIQSLRQHIKGLSGKNYQQIHGAKSPDFVLLFIPIEPAFSLAVMNDDSLYNDAFDQNIVIVSTSTLLATLRTIASIWKQEHQNRNALEIAKSAGDMYDKFVAFVEDMETLGTRLKQTQNTYDNAINKLSEGKGNLIGRAQKMKQMGANASKSLPANLIKEEE